MRVWNLQTGKLVRSFKWHSVNVRGLDASTLFSSADTADEGGALAYNPGIAMVATCGWDRTIRISNIDEVLNESESLCGGGCCLS